MDGTLSNQQVQNQQLSLTPKMLQELKVLQMSHLDLLQFVQESMIENPLLEVLETESYLDAVIKHGSADASEDDYINDDNIDDFYNYTGSPINLRDHLISQLGELKIEKSISCISLYVIENIDSRGYACTDISEIADKFKVTDKKAAKALRAVQSMDPDGVGARCLKECLLIQLRKKRMLDNDIKCVVMNYLELLGERKYDKISKILGISKFRISEIHNIIRGLNPKPGYKFSNSDEIGYINPELMVKEVHGNYLVLFTDEKGPTLRINGVYKNIIASGEASAEESRFVKGKLAKALEIINAIEMRKRTILKVASFIISYQEDFLKKGYTFLKPLTMKTVADAVGIHESTVSRTVNNKYIQTPRGTFELKFFFSGKVTSDSGSNIATSGVKDTIRKIVLQEDKNHPLSDEQIRKSLEEKGITVARRTIAKYREELSILPAKLRK